MHNWGDERLSREQLVISPPLLLVISHLSHIFSSLSLLSTQSSQATTQSGPSQLNNKSDGGWRAIKSIGELITNN